MDENNMKILTVFSRSKEQCTCKTSKGKTLSCGTKFMFAVCCKRDSKSLLYKAVLKTEIIINSPISKIPKFIYFPFRWITQLQLKN